jgi:hypothetical protein
MARNGCPTLIYDEEAIEQAKSILHEHLDNAAKELAQIGIDHKRPNRYSLSTLEAALGGEGGYGCWMAILVEKLTKRYKRLQ